MSELGRQLASAAAAVLVALASICATAEAQTSTDPAEPGSVAVGIFVDEIASVDTAQETLAATFDLAFACRTSCENLGEGFEIANGDVHSIETRTRRADFVSYRVRATLRTTFDVSGFPFDDQLLPIEVAAIADDVSVNRYFADPDLSGLRSDLEISGWSVTGSELSDTVVTAPQEEAQYSHVTLAIEVERIDRIAFLKYLLPVMVMMVLNLIQVFASGRLVPRDRVPLAGAGVLLALITYIASLASLPEKTGLTFLDGFSLLSMALFSIMLAEPLYEMSLLDEQDGEHDEHKERRERVNKLFRVAMPIVVVASYALLFVLGV